jgi:hypothetical protein
LASLIARRPVRFSPLAFLALALVAYAAVVIAFASVRERRSAVARGGAAESWPGIVAFARRILAITVFISVLLSPDYPWYYAWVVPWLVFVPSGPALLLTLAVFVLYRSINEPSATDTFSFHSQLFLPVLAWIAYRFIDRRIHPAYLNHEL